jgi:hypothetical protein
LHNTLRMKRIGFFALMLTSLLGCGSSQRSPNDDATGPGTDGIDGGRAGAGGGSGGSGGAKADAFSDGFSNACGQIPTLDRSCAVDADCMAVMHTINCCGTGVWMGIRTTDTQRFASLEAACDSGYPPCGCGTSPPTTDDGSTVAFGNSGASVACQGGQCRTFSKACGQPCGDGRSCVTCMSPNAGATSVCALRCTNQTVCTEGGRTNCEFGLSNRGICVDPALTCRTF